MRVILYVYVCVYLFTRMYMYTCTCRNQGVMLDIFLIFSPLCSFETESLIEPKALIIRFVSQ